MILTGGFDFVGPLELVGHGSPHIDNRIQLGTVPAGSAGCCSKTAALLTVFAGFGGCLDLRFLGSGTIFIFARLRVFIFVLGFQDLQLILSEINALEMCF